MNHTLDTLSLRINVYSNYTKLKENCLTQASKFFMWKCAGILNCPYEQRKYVRVQCIQGDYLKVFFDKIEKDFSNINSCWQTSSTKTNMILTFIVL